MIFIIALKAILFLLKNISLKEDIAVKTVVNTARMALIKIKYNPIKNKKNRVFLLFLQILIADLLLNVL